ncbi:MAG: hypothetical protein OT643_14265 [Bacteroidetes bacterium]|nr:hypothetical protein [Bacteroidota bacterium]
MKKSILIVLSLIIFSLTSCDLTTEPEITGTNTQAMAGEWVLDLFDEAGTHLAGQGLMTTTNTAANTASEMWLIDHDFFGMQFKASTDQNAKTMSSSKAANIEFAPGDAPDPSVVLPLGETTESVSAVPEFVTISGGILSGAAHPPSGTTTDSMRFTITAIYRSEIYTASSYDISAETGDTTVVWGITSSSELPDGPYVIQGHRRTGFLEDEPH